MAKSWLSSHDKKRKYSIGVAWRQCLQLLTHDSRLGDSPLISTHGAEHSGVCEDVLRALFSWVASDKLLLYFLFSLVVYVAREISQVRGNRKSPKVSSGKFFLWCQL